MTYLFWGELSDSWPASLHRTGARWGCFEGEQDLRAMRRAGLIWGQVGLVRWKSRPAYPEPAIPSWLWC